MTTLTAPSRNAVFNDGVSTSSSTLVNPDIEEETRRKLSTRAPMYGRSHLSSRADTSGSSAKPFTDKLTGSGAMTSTWTGPRMRKADYPDDHRCSDQEYASGLCGCTQDGSAESSSSTSLADEPLPRRRPSRRSSSEDARLGEETYDMKMIAARRKKLLSERNMKSSPDKKVSPNVTPSHLIKESLSPPSASFSRDLQSDPVLVQRERKQSFSAEYDDDERGDRRNADLLRQNDKVHRAWVSSPTPSPQLDIVEAAGLVYSEYDDSSKNKIQKGSPGAKRQSHLSAPRKSIDTFYQNLLMEEQQRQEDIRRKKEAARERRRQELRNRQESQRPVTTSSRDAKDAGMSSHDDASLFTSHAVLKSSSAQEPEKGSSSFQATESLPFETGRENSISPSRIAPRPSPVKPAAEAYKARLLALRSSSTSSFNTSKEVKSPEIGKSYLGSSQKKVIVKKGDESKDAIDDQVTLGSDYTGQAPLQSTPPRSANTSANLSRSKDSSIQLNMELPTSEGDKTIRDTLQQLTLALQEVNELKSDPNLRAKLSAALQQGIQADLDPLVKQKAIITIDRPKEKEIGQDDDRYVEKLETVRERIKVLSKNASLQHRGDVQVHIRGSWKRLFLTLLFQLFILILMITAAELRARQLFLTTYYDPFQPSGLFAIPSATIDTFLQPLMMPDSLDSAFQTTPININGSIYHIESKTTHSVFDIWRAPFKYVLQRIGWHHASKTMITLFGLKLDGSDYACNYSPT